MYVCARRLIGVGFFAAVAASRALAAAADRPHCLELRPAAAAMTELACARYCDLSDLSLKRGGKKVGQRQALDFAAKGLAVDCVICCSVQQELAREVPLCRIQPRSDLRYAAAVL